MHTPRWWARWEGTTAVNNCWLQIVSQLVVLHWLEKSNDSKMLWLLIILSSLYDMGTHQQECRGGGGVLMSAQHGWSYQQITPEHANKKLHQQHQHNKLFLHRSRWFMNETTLCLTQTWGGDHHPKCFLLLLHHPTCPNNTGIHHSWGFADLTAMKRGSYCTALSCKSDHHNTCRPWSQHQGTQRYK